MFQTAISICEIASSPAGSQRNSSIYGCHLFGSFVATVHVSLQPGEWRPGKAMPPDVLLNVHTLQGRALLSDAKLVDLPVAHDADSLYIAIMDQARSPAGTSQFRLQRLRLVDSGGTLAAWASTASNSDETPRTVAHR